VLKIEIVKRPGGAGLLRCTRADGSMTWQKQSDRHAAHFTHHDLTHFAVETTLGYKQGFFGLIASGWDIEDTIGKGSRGPIPAEAGEVERIVGLFDTEHASGTLWTAEEFAQYAPPNIAGKLDDATIRAIRLARSALFCRWAEVATGGKLELSTVE